MRVAPPHFRRNRSIGFALRKKKKKKNSRDGIFDDVDRKIGSDGNLQKQRAGTIFF